MKMGGFRVVNLDMESYAKRYFQESRVEKSIKTITPIKRSKWHCRKTRQALITETARSLVASMAAPVGPIVFRIEKGCKIIMIKSSIKTRYCLSIFPIIFKLYLRLT